MLWAVAAIAQYYQIVLRCRVTLTHGADDVISVLWSLMCDVV
jgi:hypothetical protein